MTQSLVPFGKYKGQPVEVLAQDRDYCEWLAGQEWFRMKFVGIHTLIVNHFGEPNETPEHNALQARFLDPDWCQRFAVLMGLSVANCVMVIERWHRKLVARDHSLEIKEGQVRPIDQLRLIQRERAVLAAALGITQTVSNTDWVCLTHAAFERGGIDVCLNVSITSRKDFELTWDAGLPPMRGHLDCYHGGSSIECKPALGDDYPAVLRKMHAHDVKCLVAEAVHSAVVSLDQIKEIFQRSGIRLVTVDEIVTTPLLWQSSSGSNELGRWPFSSTLA